MIQRLSIIKAKMGVLGSSWFADKVSVSCHLPPPGAGIVNGKDHLSCFFGCVGVVNGFLIASNLSSLLDCDSVAAWRAWHEFRTVVQVPTTNHNIPCNGSTPLINQSSHCKIEKRFSRENCCCFFFFFPQPKTIKLAIQDGMWVGSSQSLERWVKCILYHGLLTYFTNRQHVQCNNQTLKDILWWGVHMTEKKNLYFQAVSLVPTI